MRTRCKNLLVLSLLLLVTTSISAQKFNFTYNGTTITYEIISVTKHEVKVDYVPENVTVVTVPSVVFFNGENFRVTTIGRGGSRDGGWFGSYEGERYYSFNNCKLLKQVVLPNTIKVIGYGAFRGCTWLRSINMPSGLEVIGGEAFEDCESLTSITIPSSVKEVGEFAFNRCKCVINIPATIDTINQSAFYGCKFRLSEKLGYVWNDTIVLNTGYDSIISYGSYYYNDTFFKWGKKIIYKNAFGSNYTIIDLRTFNNKVISSPKYYLSSSVGNPIASNIKKSLIEAEMYDMVLSFYPKDAEVQMLQRNAEIKRLMEQANDKRVHGYYAEAKHFYERALVISPNDKAINDRVNEMDEAIAKQERQCKVAEEKARREAEERHVREDIDSQIKMAQNQIVQGHLWESIETLENAVKITQVHNYDYRSEEIARRIDSIRMIQELISDDSKVFNYKDFRPDLYQLTQDAIKLKIRSSLMERKKTIEGNNVLFMFYTNNQPGTFQLRESSRTLKKLCTEILNTVRLQPLVFDDNQLKATAAYNYDVEYVSGTVKVKQRGGRPQQIDTKFDMSPRLESNLQTILQSNLGTLSTKYDGNYKFRVVSMNVGGQMEHDIQMKSVHCLNGPQNAWRSLVLPFWGDKYVGGGLFGDGGYLRWYGAFLCYASVGWGIYSIIDETKQAKQYNSTANVRYYIGMITIGGAVWLGDVIYVWIKGAKNKKECKERFGRMSFAYDAVHDAPELVYSLKF